MLSTKLAVTLGNKTVLLENCSWVGFTFVNSLGTLLTLSPIKGIVAIVPVGLAAVESALGSPSSIPGKYTL